MDNRKISGKLRFSFMSHEYPPIGGGASSALYALTKRLALRGHQVQILTIGLLKRTEQETDTFGRTIIRFGAGRKKIFSPSAWELLRSYFALRYLARPHLGNFKPDVLTAFFAFPSGHAAIALGKRLKVPVIISLRGSDVPGFSDKRWGIFQGIRTFLLHPVWRQADLLAANGNHLLQLAEEFMKTDKIFNLPNGVDTGTYYPPSRRNTRGPIKILFVGQLIERKRCQEVLEGVEWLVEQGGAAELTIVGDGPLWPVIELYARQIQNKVRIILMGHVERDKMPEIYRKHDVLVMLSRAEGVSNVLLESLASGLCLVTSYEASKDVFTDKQAGVVIDKVTPAAIGSTLLNLAKNYDLRLTMQRAARNLSEGFDWDNTAISFEDQVFRLLAENTRSYPKNHERPCRY